MNRCGCYGSLGLKRTYLSFVEARQAGDEAEQRFVERRAQHGQRVDPLVLWVYPCPVDGGGYHLSKLTPEAQAAKELKRKRAWEEARERPELPYTDLSKLMWDATTLADIARGSVARSRADVVELLFHPHQGWQASAPVKPTSRRDRWVRATGTTAEEAVTKLIKALTPLSE